MPRMSDFDINSAKWNVGLCSEAGAGKSTMAATFPGKKFVFDFDDKMAAYEGTDTFYHTFPTTPDGYRGVKLLLENAISQNGILYMDGDGEFFNDMGWPLTEGEEMRFDCYILDSVTGFEKSCMEQALVDDARSKSPADGLAEHHYLYSMQRCLQVLDKIKLLPTSRITTFHFEILEVRKKGTVVDTMYYPLMIGKTRFRMRKEFGEWYHLFSERDGDDVVHKMNTHSTGHEPAFTTLGYDTARTTHILDSVEVPSFPHLIDKIAKYWEGR